MITYKVIREGEKRKEKFNKIVVDSVICQVTIAGMAKTLTFARPASWYLYLRSDEQVYVHIPRGGTRRALTSLYEGFYFNKVRRASLYLQNIRGKYHLVQLYKVLDGEASIMCWVTSDLGEKLRSSESYDSIVPQPIFNRRD